MENFTTKRGGCLAVTRCPGLSPCEGRGALHAQYPAPLFPRDHHSRLLDPFSLNLGRGVSRHPPLRYVPFSLSGGGRTRGTSHAGSSLPSGFLLFPCPGLCSGSHRNLSASSFPFFQKSGLLNWLLISFPIWLLPTQRFFDPNLPVKLSARTAQQYCYPEQGSESPSKASPHLTWRNVQARSPRSSCLEKTAD